MFEGEWIADPIDANAEALLDNAQYWERIIAHAQAQQLKALAAFANARRDPNGRWHKYDVDELALGLQLSGAAAGTRLKLALELTHKLPQTLIALERGEIDLLRARAVADATAPLSAEQAHQVEDRVLARACGQNAPQVRQAVRRAVLRVDPDGASARHRERLRDREVVLLPAEDGMAQLNAYLPAAAAGAIYDKISHHAEQARSAEDQRTPDQRRADVFVDLLLGSESPNRRCGRAVVQVNVTVAATTLLGLDELPGELVGHGPIPADLARQLAADATWRRLLTDPASGTLLDYGRTTYRPPAGLARFVRARDGQCRFPGCLRSAAHCDLDHRVEYPNGPTSADNLDALCPRHHAFKHQQHWQVWRDQDGSYHWTSPAGRHYVDPPEPILEPAQVSTAPPAPSPADDDQPPF